MTMKWDLFHHGTWKLRRRAGGTLTQWELDEPPHSTYYAKSLYDQSLCLTNGSVSEGSYYSVSVGGHIVHFPHYTHLAYRHAIQKHTHRIPEANASATRNGGGQSSETRVRWRTLPAGRGTDYEPSWEEPSGIARRVKRAGTQRQWRLRGWQRIRIDGVTSR